MTWILVIFMLAPNGAGVSLVRVGGYTTNAACSRQGEDWLKAKVFTEKPGFIGGGYQCIPIDKEAA